MLELLLSLLAVLRAAWCDRRSPLVLVRAETVVRWHRPGWRLYRRWKSRTRLGRHCLSAKVRDLIATARATTPSGAPSGSEVGC
jgi:putative transposase